MSRDSRRTDLLERLADHVLAHGLGTASLRPLAAAVGTSDRMLLYYFPDKAALVGALLETIAARMTALLDANRLPNGQPQDALYAHLLPLVLDESVWPFMQIWLEIASSAARGDQTCRRVGESIARGFLAWIGEHLLMENEADRRADATRVLIRIEGAVLLKSLGLGDEVHSVAG